MTFSKIFAWSEFHDGTSIFHRLVRTSFLAQKRTKQNCMFWGTVVEPGARVAIMVPSNVQGLRINRALPYEMESGFSRHRLFIETQKAPPILVCNDSDGCNNVDINLSRSDLDRGPVLYETNGECRWALSGVAVEDTAMASEPRENPGSDSAKDWAQEAAFLTALTLVLTMANSFLLFSK